ncbi:hypothetical protein OG788_04515 [Streptomyces sp. NBC_00647]|uniref:hypothetical protein n=1 Tax=Streptomyces sp. NBC_00647 TaxID=2975796 RepID=UPI0032493B46
MGAREVLSRALFGGFWAVVAVVVGSVSLAGLFEGRIGGFLLGTAVAAAAGFYALYVFRGGRFRFLII